jgi:phosphatidylglycerophosphate synthase
VLLLRGDAILDERLVAGLAEAPGTALVAPELGVVGAHVAASEAQAAAAALRAGDLAAALPTLREVAPSDLAPAYIANLRKFEAPYVHAAHPDRAREVEALTFAASYKGITDLVTRWVWPAPASMVTRWCAEAGIRPNTVTLWSWVFAILAMALFAKQQFAAGLAVAWAMTFLDTVDGKLARVTLTSSRLGDVLDHGLDLLHPPFWYLAWAIGTGSAHPLEIWIVVGGYVVGRLLEGAFLAAFKIETHSWRPIDSLFRTITARRNPNLILLTVGTGFGRPDLGFTLVALWTAVSLGFHALRLGQAFATRARGTAIVPWDDPAAEDAA